MTPKKPTRFQLHCEAWREGCGSEFCAGAMKKTFYRGSIPADIVFVGEAPGKSENLIGQPFIGPAGKLLDGIIERGIPKKYRVGLTNLVICIPRKEGEEKVEPDPDQIDSCRPRLEELLVIANPKLIFAVGTQARDALTGGYLHSTKLPPGSKVVHIVHPAWILRQTVAFQGLEIQRVICQLRDEIHLLENPPKKLDIPEELRTKTNLLANKDARGFPIKAGTAKKSVLPNAPLHPPKEESDILHRPDWDSDEIPF